MSDYLKKFKQLTSKWGIYQHGLLSIPNPEFGYAIDDQARALIVAHQFNQYKLEKIFLNFILNSKIDDTYYHYFYDNKNSISPDITHQASEDALGMVVWALIETGNTTGDSKKVIQNILTKAKSWIFLRSIAYILLGLTESKKTILEDDLVKKIIDSYKEDNGWNWFEDKLTYGNALIPWALWKRARTRQDNKSLEVAKKATEFLLKIYQKDGTPMPVSHLGLRKDDNNRLYKLYETKLRDEMPGVHAGGRLGMYRYLNMDQAIGPAMTLVGRLVNG